MFLNQRSLRTKQLMLSQQLVKLIQRLLLKRNLIDKLSMKYSKMLMKLE
jgi:hypothetical protein